jgi:hypothetical protein
MVAGDEVLHRGPPFLGVIDYTGEFSPFADDARGERDDREEGQ